VATCGNSFEAIPRARWELLPAAEPEFSESFTTFTQSLRQAFPILPLRAEKRFPRGTSCTPGREANGSKSEGA